MSLPLFLRQLFDHGRVTVELTDGERANQRELETLLREQDQTCRSHLPAELPPLDPAVAAWSAKTLYQAAQVLVYRDLGCEVLQPAKQSAPRGVEAGEQASVDLCLRFLPDLVRLARAAATSDPLVTWLLELGADWPLSSVGINGVAVSEIGKSRVQALAKNAAVWRIYVDRVLQTGDASRLEDPATKTAVRVAVGAFPHLAGKLSSLVGSS